MRSKDAPALSLAEEILAGGASSRLYQALVYEQQIAQAVTCSADLREDLGLLVFRVVLASGKPVAEAKKSLTDQIENVIKKGVTEAELDKAKNRFLTSKLLERETANGKASALGEAAVVYGDATRVNTDLAKVQAVTTAQIKDVLNKYVTGKKKVVIEYLPESMKTARERNEREKVLMKTRTLFSIGVVFFAALQCAYAIGGIDTPPPPSAPSDISFAQPKEARLENGLRVIVAERPGLPLLAAELLVRTGAEIDPEGLAGAASMTGSLLTEGTEKMSATQIAVAIESLGGAIDSGARWDASSASVVVMSDKAEAALSILSDVVLHPAFKQEEIDRLKKQTLDSLRVVMQQPGALARYVTDRVVYGSSEYGHAAGGTMETVQAITARRSREDFTKPITRRKTPRSFWREMSRWSRGRNTRSNFSAIGRPSHPPAKSLLAPLRLTGSRRTSSSICRKPARPRSRWPSRRSSADSPDYYAGLVTNAALGTGFVSRLNREIRIKRGLSYGARSALDSRRNGGSFFASAQTKNESAAEVAGLLQSELKRLGTEPVQGEELKSRQAVLTGGYARNLETNRGLVAQIASLVTYDRPLDTVNKFIPTINAITAADVSAFAAKYFATPPSLVIVGKAPDFLEALKKDFPDVRGHPPRRPRFESGGPDEGEAVIKERRFITADLNQRRFQTAAPWE